MTTTTQPRPTRRPRGEGQWALGYREPLNANEQNKKDDHPLNVRDRIENIYAHAGFDSIDKSDLRGRYPGGATSPRASRVTTAPGPAMRTPTCRRPGK